MISFDPVSTTDCDAILILMFMFKVFCSVSCSLRDWIYVESEERRVKDTVRHNKRKVQYISSGISLSEKRIEEIAMQCVFSGERCVQFECQRK